MLDNSKDGPKLDAMRRIVSVMLICLLYDQIFNTFTCQPIAVKPKHFHACLLLLLEGSILFDGPLIRQNLQKYIVLCIS